MVFSSQMRSNRFVAMWKLILNIFVGVNRWKMIGK